MAFLASTWWIWMIVMVLSGIVGMVVFLGRPSGRASNAAVGVFLAVVLIFPCSAAMFVLGVIAALIAYAKG